MSLAPFYDAPFMIQLHLSLAICALVVGPFALFRKRKDLYHKIAGYIWILAIVGVAISGLIIPSNIAVIAHFGPIHLFSIFSLWGVTEGLWYIRRGNIAKHRASMQSVWFGAMGLAGLFTLLPGRTMNRIVFGEQMQLGWIAIVLGLIALAITWRWHLRRVGQMPLGKAGGLD